MPSFLPSNSAVAMSALDRLFNFSGPITEFWPVLIENVLEIFELDHGVALRRDRLAATPWEKLASGSRLHDEETELVEISAPAAALAAEATARGHATVSGSSPGEDSLLALRLGQEEPGRDIVVLLSAPHAISELGEPEQEWLRLLTYAVRLQLLRRTGNRQGPEQAQIALALDLVLLLNEQKKAQAANMLFCNEIASRFGASRVSLGWKRGEIVRLLATSHTNRFEKSTSHVLAMENAMQECFDQDAETIWPLREGFDAVVRDHEIYATRQGSHHVLSLPIRVDGEARGVLMIERGHPTFRAVEIAGLRLVCDLSSRRLDELDRRARGFLTRMKNAAEEGLALYLGPEHTWVKVGAILGSLLLAFLIFWPWPYRIQGQFNLHPRILVILPAPYEGYIASVEERPGDIVRKDQPLLSLDETEIRLQSAEAAAGEARYKSEAELAEGSDRVSDMRIADAQAQQEDSHFQQGQYDLARSTLRSPFDGVVVEGDLRERIGSPVKKGDVLIKVCQLGDMYVHIEVPEADIEHIRPHAKGEIAFASRPGATFPFEVTTIEPAAQATKDGNIFVIRADYQGTQPDWWRPGMTGVAKIDAGTASPLWLLTHRLIDFLRMKFWL